MFRRHAGIHRNVFKTRVQFAVCHVIQFNAGQRLIPVTENTNLTRNRCGCNFMVTCNHDGTHTAPRRIRNRLNRFRARRVDHGNQTDKGKAMLILERQRTDGIQLALRKGQHTQALLR